MTTSSDPLCERARCVASLRLDGELTEFEDAFLDSHLAACAACRTYSAGIAASAHTLRSTPLEFFTARLARPRRRATVSRHLQFAAAARVVTGAGLTGLSGLARPNDAGTTRTARPAYLDSQNYDQAFIRELSARRPAVRGGGLGVKPS
jgi:predicted anti-sigma-YlaC factor YlaD